MPGGLDDYENKFFGSSSTFVGDSQNVIAVGSGVDDSPIHIYRKSVASICVLMTTDTDAPSLNNIGSDGYILVEIDDINIQLFQFFGAGEVVLDRCFDRIDTNRLPARMITDGRGAFCSLQMARKRIHPLYVLVVLVTAI